MKKKLSFPHTYVIIVVLIALAVLLTWIVPAGKFPRVKNEASGQMVIVADQFKYVEKHPINPLRIPLFIVKGLIKSANIVFLILIVGGAFNIII